MDTTIHLAKLTNIVFDIKFILHDMIDEWKSAGLSDQEIEENIAEWFKNLKQMTQFQFVRG